MRRSPRSERTYGRFGYTEMRKTKKNIIEERAQELELRRGQDLEFKTSSLHVKTYNLSKPYLGRTKASEAGQPIRGGFRKIASQK